MAGKLHLLGLSDIEIGFVYSPMVVERFQNIDLIFSCGDLPYYYLEYVVSMLNVPMYYVRGNHASKVEFTSAGDRTNPWGAVNLHRRVLEDDTGLLLAGLEGSLQYNRGPYQYSQNEYWYMVYRLVPSLLLNKIRFGRYLDVFITHAPAWHIHDQSDRPHQGIKAFRWLIDVFQPAYFLHGHIHVLRNDTITRTQVGNTQILNVYGFREFEIDTPAKRSWQR
ncbi:MAG TPA: metallophosphoesterase [Anaerolineaceae bacterium]|nr:metallophosphoesterase [Anaerolineaceae bacterium]